MPTRHPTHKLQESLCKQPLGEHDDSSVASKSLPRAPSLDIVTSIITDVDIVNNRDFFKCPPNVITFDIVNDRDFFKCPPDIATRHRHPASSKGSLHKDCVKDRFARIASRNASQGLLRKDRFARIASQGSLRKDRVKECLARIASRNASQGSRQGTPHKDCFARIASRNASQGSLRKDRVKECLARIASRNASQGSLRRDRFTRTASQGPLHKNHFTRAASQAQNKFETLSTSVQRIHHRKSKQLGETFDDFSVASWSLSRTSSPTSSSTPTSSF